MPTSAATLVRLWSCALARRACCGSRSRRSGAAAHGAHVHKGVNAIDRLRSGARSGERPRAAPSRDASSRSRTPSPQRRPISEPLSGAGESDTLSRVTVNIGTIAGGVSPNLVPNAGARAMRHPSSRGDDDGRAPGEAGRLAAAPGRRDVAPHRDASSRTSPIPTMRSSPGCAMWRRRCWGAAPAVNMRVGGSEFALVSPAWRADGGLWPHALQHGRGR